MVEPVGSFMSLDGWKCACDVVDVRAFGAKGNGVADDTAAIQKALDAHASGEGIICFPPGTYVVTASLTHMTSTNTGGPIILGAGRYRTLIDNRVANDAAFRFESSAHNVFQRGGLLANLSIMTAETPRPATSHGIYLRGVWQMKLQNVRVDGLSGDGIRVESLAGDPDAPVVVILDNCYLWNNTLYGLRCTNAAPRADLSFVSLRDCMIQGNTGGGIYWNGQQLSIENTGIATNRGSGGLLVSFDNAGNSQLVNIIGSTFENNQPRHIDLESCLNGYFAGCEFTSRAAFPTTDAIRIGRPGVGIVRNLMFINTTVNIAPAISPHTFFLIDSSANEVNILNTRWQSYDATGQTRYSYPAGPGVDLRLSSLHLVSPLRSTDLILGNGNNNDIDIGTEHGFLRITGPSAAFALTGFKNGYNGRILMLVNVSNQDMGVKNEDAASAAASRIMTRGGVDVNIDHNQGTAWFVYNGTNQRWVFMGSN